VGTDNDGQIIATGSFDLAAAVDCSADQQAQVDEIVAVLDRANRWVFLEALFVLLERSGNNLLLATDGS
jgi:hypothetical protein